MVVSEFQFAITEASWLLMEHRMKMKQQTRSGYLVPVLRYVAGSNVTSTQGHRGSFPALTALRGRGGSEVPAEFLQGTC